MERGATGQFISGLWTDTDLATKLWGPARQLQRTADLLAATELRIWHGHKHRTQKKKKNLGTICTRTICTRQGVSGQFVLGTICTRTICTRQGVSGQCVHRTICTRTICTRQCVSGQCVHSTICTRTMCTGPVCMKQFIRV